MPTQISDVVQYLRRAILRHDESGLTDGQLLGRFIEQRDEAAVAALVRRHGPMVWGVCRRILRTHHDAEDAFQATFLVLIRKAESVRKREMVGNWLYGVAHQTSLKARATAAKHFAREKQVLDMPEPAVKEPDLCCDLQGILDQELSRLPDKYRVGIVLCDLEGKTRKEAARQLGLPEGTLAGRLTRGRAILAKRLARNGLTVTGGTLAAVLSQEAASGAVPTSVLSSTIKAVTLVASGNAAAGVISAKVVALTEGVVKAMFLSKIKTMTAMMLVLVLVAFGGGLLLVPSSAKAIPLMPFTDTATLVEKAKDIVLAECLTEALEPGVDGIAPCDVRIVAVIKGDRKIGKQRVGTSGLEKGRTYMLTGFGGSVNNIDFIINGELAVVELPPHFDIGSLKRKNPVQQVQTIFDARREWIELRLRVLASEKSLLDRAARSQKDEELFRGNWEVKKADALGVHLPRETSLKQIWAVKDGEIIIQFDDGVKEKWTFTLDPTVTPRLLDLKVTAGVKAGASAKGIYELKGNTLRICFNGNGERPSRFDMAALGASRWGRLFVLERAPSQPPPTPADQPK